MTSSDRNILARVISDALKPLGFKKRGDSWYAQRAEAIQVVNLQKSAWGGQRYVNLAVWLRALGEHETPKEHECHVRIRLTALPGVDRGVVEQALSLDEPGVAPDQRANIVKNALTKFGIPALESVSTVAGLARAIENASLEYALVHQAVGRLAGYKGPRP